MKHDDRPYRLRLGTLLPLLALLILAPLAGCGSGSIYTNQPTPTEKPGQATPNPNPYVFFYSRVDYPLQIPVNGSDTVTLTLSFKENVVLATPAVGTGNAAGIPFSLPTDLSPYRDILAMAVTGAKGESPVVWQEISPAQQSLLAPGVPGASRDYVSAVVFRWRAYAAHVGQSLMTISLVLYYLRTDGTEQQGTMQVSPTPLPILAVQSTASNTFLSSIRDFLTGLFGIAGVLATVLGVVTGLSDLSEKLRGKRTAPTAVADAHWERLSR